MKKLEEYETPETDRDDRQYPLPEYTQRIQFEGSECVVIGPEDYEALYEHARALERKLSMCRDVLKLYDDAFCDGPENCGYLRFEEIYEQARITLKATEPK